MDNVFITDVEESSFHFLKLPAELRNAIYVTYLTNCPPYTKDPNVKEDIIPDILEYIANLNDPAYPEEGDEELPYGIHPHPMFDYPIGKYPLFTLTCRACDGIAFPEYQLDHYTSQLWLVNKQVSSECRSLYMFEYLYIYLNDNRYWTALSFWLESTSETDLRSVRQVRVVPHGGHSFKAKGFLLKALEKYAQSCFLYTTYHIVQQRYFDIRVTDDGNKLEVRAPFALSPTSCRKIHAVLARIALGHGTERRFDGKNIFEVITSLENHNDFTFEVDFEDTDPIVVNDGEKKCHAYVPKIEHDYLLDEIILKSPKASG
ncbi:hypothetical protein EJ08DRAFT_303940 [Tothia fuscella]|uniref:Uncharacterized protein n=1 Tax=Tothia fuscella TaxID=1048955 RepID=A0A9P4NPB5_9PEZI|nr:hypothetical protein EJ08DRAFT_303940 [Tothia fuscella]